MVKGRIYGKRYVLSDNSGYTTRGNESLNTIDNFSLNRIISLCDHKIYRDGRRFAVYRWGVDPKQIEEQGICPENAKNQMENKDRKYLPFR